MTGFIDNIHLALPEIIIMIAASTALLGDLFLRHRYPSIAFVVAIVGLGMAGMVSFLFLNQYTVILFNGLFISDDISQLMKLFIYVTVFLSFVYSKSYLTERKMPSGEFYVLGLLSTVGMMTLVSAHSLLTVYLGVELLSLPLYAMTAIRQSNKDGSEAAMKYFVIGAIASGMLLYGMSLLYGATGQLDLQEIAKTIALTGSVQKGLLSFAMVFILAGIGFKLAAVPFHMWAPDVYAGAPTSVTLFLSAAPKIAAMGMALRILTLSLGGLTAEWQQLILVMALLSAVLGNLVAIAQTNIKRMFAYSTISHMGFALFGILAGTTEGFSASLYYILIYALMSVGAFGMIVLMSRLSCDIEQIEDLNGLNKRNPWLSFMMMIILLSMAGIPPTVGFFAKLLVLKALVDIHMIWVAVIALLFAVVGSFYYLRIIKVMYFEAPLKAEPIRLPRITTAIISANCLSLLYLGIFPSALIAACVNAFS